MMPPLPESDVHCLPSYTEDQMIEYGKACREQALAEAALLCENEKWNDENLPSPVTFISTYNDACEDCSEAIGRLV